MTEKRFGMIKTESYGLYVPVDEKKKYLFPSFEDELDCIRFVNVLNELNDEKESWKQSYIEEVGDIEEQSKCLLKLSIENDELKKEIQNLQAKLNILEQAIKDEKQ